MKHRIFYILPVLLLVLPVALSAEERFDVSADKLSGTRTGDEDVVILEGNVRIVHGTTVATADTGFYYRKRETVDLIGRVTVEDRDVRVMGRKAKYLRPSGMVIFSHGIEAEDAGSRLVADRGEFDLRNEVLDVRGHVLFTEDARRLRADQAIYFRKTRSVTATGGVVIEDDDYGASIWAGRVRYERGRRYGVASGDPLLETVERDGREGMSVTADSMELYVDERRAIAIGDVRIYRKDAVGRCGRAVFLDDQDRTVLTENPTVVDKGSSLSGETITIVSRDDEVSEVLVSGNAKSIYQPPDEERTELTGADIAMHFADGELSRMIIQGEARAVFSPQQADTAGQASTNQVSGNRIDFRFKEGEAEEATVTGGVNGTYQLDDGSPEGGLVGYRSDSLHYDVPVAVMHLEGNAYVEYKSMKLHSELIEYNSRTHNLFAPVRPLLVEGNDKITGESMTYNLRTKRGAITAGRTGYEKGLYTGRVIRKTGDQVLNVSGGTYTSCNHLDPHYTFTSSHMKLYVNDKVITRPLVLRVRGMPLLAIPFFMFPIRQGRHSGILIPRVEFGFDESKGRFIRNAGYYWAPSPYFDVTAWGDYYEDTKWTAHLETRYKVRYLLDGTFKGSYQSDMNTGRSRWDIDGRHTQEVGENGKLIVHADFVSDKEYRQQTSDVLEERLRRQLESDISYSTSWNGKSLTLAAERRENLDTDQVSQTLPRIRFLLSRVTLIEPMEADEGWHRGTYLSLSSNASGTLSKASGVQKTQQQARADLSLTSDLRFSGRSQSLRSSMVLTSVRKGIPEWCSGCVGGKVVNSAFGKKTDFIAKFMPFGWLNFDPSLTTSFVVYDEDKAGDRLPVRFMYWGGLSSKTSIYKTFFPRFGPLQAVRHVISPSITYTHRPDFSKYQDRFYSLPGISGEVGKAQTMNISVSNKLHVKVGSGGEVRKINDVLSLTTSTSYDFLYREKSKPTPFSTITNNLRFYPTRYATFDVSFTNDPVDFDFESLDLTTRLSYTGREPLPPGFAKPDLAEPELAPEEGVGGADAASPTAKAWQIGAIFRYTKAFDGADDSYWLDFQAGINLTTNWRVDYSGRFDLSGKEVAYQEYSVYRDLHCWEASFVRRQSAGEWQYYFRINIKAHPEIYTERGLRALSRQY